MMEEKKAKKTICPKLSGYVSAGVEGDVDFYECLCFGSACQWWIWEVRRNEQGEQLKWTTGHCGAIK